MTTIESAPVPDVAGLLHANRVILAHFDSYSAALLFACQEQGLLGPAPLPPGATPLLRPDPAGPEHDGAAVLQAAVAHYGLNPDEVERMADFDAWFMADGAPLRVHALRFTGFAAPAGQLAALGMHLRPISALRGAAMNELLLLREIFNLLVGGARRA